MASKRSMRKKLRALSEQDAQERRDLGAAVLAMYRNGEVNFGEIEAAGAKLTGIERESKDLTATLEGKKPEPDGGETEEKPALAAEDPKARTEADPPTEVRALPANGPAAPASEESPAGGESPGAEEPEAAAVEPEAAAGAEPAAEPQPAEGATPTTEPAPTAAPAVEPGPEVVAEPVPEPEDDRSAAVIADLEADLEHERERVAQGLEGLKAELDAANDRVEQAEERSRRREAEVRTAAAEWLRGQAEAMRHEALRQVREETADAGEAESTTAPAPAGKRQGSEGALADMTRRSNEANARAQKAEAALEVATAEAEERGRRQAEEKLGKELAARDEELDQERRAKAEALDAAERRLAEIEAQVSEAERRAAQAASSAGAGKVALNLATFDQLRELGLSPTQANRVIAYRERLGGYKSLADLGNVPGMPESLVGELKQRLEL